MGQLVTTLYGNTASDNGLVTKLDWDGRGNSGELLSGGVYVYTMKVTDEQGTQRQITQRLIISR